ncbi:MAG: hypothetical protein LH481_06265 [Burkholderiales bacterium]|nr:hypothetical protein [Burkholderiales bacterium]
MLSVECLATVKSRFEFSPVGETVGNLTIGRGRAPLGAGAAPAPIFVALIENRIASGSLGFKECEKLTSLFKVIEVQKIALVLYIDSAGARVSEGLVALGAFRHMYRAAVSAAASGAPITAFCGANCFGGASMLAALATRRVYSENTRFAMSGPSILAQAAGFSALDDVFLAMSMAATSGASRAKLGAADMMVTNPISMETLAPVDNTAIDRHLLLEARLAQLKSTARPARTEKVERKDLVKLYPQGYQLEERNGVLVGEAQYEGRKVLLAGFIGGTALGAERAWAQADAIWKMLGTDAMAAGSVASAPPGALHILVDCDSHATALDDERIMLSAYLANLACALHALARAGTHIETTVLGKLGGGVYVAIAAPVAQVNMLYGTEIQLLPGRAIASILGEAAMQKHEFSEYKLARVADHELKLGIV